MVNYVIFALMLFVKFNYMYPLDQSNVAVTPPSTATYRADPTVALQATTINKNKIETDSDEKAKYDKLIKLEKIALDISEAIRQLKEVKYEDTINADVLSKGQSNVAETVLTPGDAESENEERDLHREQGSLRDLQQYERYVITKKYPYLEVDNGNKQRTPSSAVDSLKPVARDTPNVLLAGDQGIYEPADDVRNIEITNRGLTGFEIPNAMHISTELNEKRLFKKAKNPQDNSQDENIVERLKKLINEYEEKKNRNKA